MNDETVDERVYTIVLQMLFRLEEEATKLRILTSVIRAALSSN